MKYLIILLLALPISWWYRFNLNDEAFKEDIQIVQQTQSTGSLENFAGLCDSVTIFLSQLRTTPSSCCFQLILDNKLRNAITQIKLDINTATFTNIVAVTNQGWIVSQTLQKDILLSHNSGFIPIGGASPLTFCLKGGFNPDSLKISFNYSAFGTAGTCNINTVICSDPVPCQASFNITQIGSCGHYQVTNTSSGVLPITYQWCSGETTPNLDVMLPCGPHTFCVTAKCADGTTSTATQTIIVSDNIPPKAVCNPGIGVVLNSNCSFNVTPGFVDGGSTDNCQIQSLSVSPAILTGCSNQNVTLTVTDWCGNKSTCTMGIQTTESVPPVITCPPTLTLLCNTNTNPPATGVATATDNCTPTPSIVITQSDMVTGILPCNATIVRTWVAKDACDNSSTCQQRILIKDNVTPTIKCPPNTIVNTNVGVCFYTGVLPQPTAMDNCDQNLDFTCSLLTTNSSILISAQTQFPKGVNNITCFAKDDCGNQSQNCNFTLTVVDNQPPTITCPGNMSVTGLTNAQGLCKAVVNNLAPMATDNCPMLAISYSITGMTTGSGNNDASGTNFMQGVSTVTYTATDMGGNTKSCSFNITVTCPKPKCDSVSVMWTQETLSAFPYACLYHFTINNQATNISKVQLNLKTATISGASGHNPYILNFLAPSQITFTAGGNIPIGSFLAADINIAGGSNPDTAVVKFFYNNGLSTCDTNIIFNCPLPPPPKTKCDSVSAFMLPYQAIPYACTSQFHINNQASGITKVEVNLKTASFASITPIAPFNATFITPSKISITHSSTFIPIGTFYTVDLAINGGSNPDTAVVKFFYNNGLSTCDTNIIFNCPVDTTCGYDPSCAVNSISLNTGLDNNGQLISPGSYDPNWMITKSPYIGSNLPSPAEVIQKYSSWDFQPNSIASCSQWISVFQGATQQNNVSFLDPYTYTRCFCVCKDNAKITIQLSAMADNNANFRLYDASGNLVSPLLVISYPSSLPQAFQLPPDVSTTNLVLNKGTYCIRADVRNYANVTGINVCGSISGEGLIKPGCCETNSYIVGHKYEDAKCNGLLFANQPALPGWKIVLCNAAGIAIDTVITDVNGYYGFGPVKPGNYSVKEINQPGWTISNPINNLALVQLDTHQVKEVNFSNCPPTTCDSISFRVESLKTIPPGCCFRLHIDNKVKNKFTQIPITINTASFNSITVDNFNGWFANQSNLSSINLMFNANNNSFIPVGSFTPLSWCINGGSNPDTIHIKVDYLVGQTKVSCDTSFTFFCPPQPDTTCGIGCKADSISLNTGVDQSTGLFYPPGSPDAYWTVVQTPYPLYVLPKPAYAMTTPAFWHDQPSSLMPCSKWINFSGGPYHYDGGLYEFTRCFCICKDGARIQIHLSALVDNAVDFTLCDSTGATVSLLMSASNFIRPPKDTTVLLTLDKGKYCIKASVYNYGHTYTGLNVCGSIKGDGLVKEICCSPSSIIGVKYIDTLCVGLPYNGTQQTLQGWQIVLCNNQGIALDTVTTDQNGSYSFSPLLPGLYTVKEMNQTGWTPSLPATGMSSIFVGANQVSQVNFGNCPPEIDSCCKSKSLFIQHISNAVQLMVLDSSCKAKINLRLPSCDTARNINWGDGTTQQGPFTNGMWMHTYTQSGTYTIIIPIVEYDINGKPCFDTLLRFSIEMNCNCACGKYTLAATQNGFVTPLHCNDTLTLGCPTPTALSIHGNFVCAGDSCLTPPIQWTLTGQNLNSSGNTGPGNIQINIPALSNGGYYTLNFQTVCGQQKCTCKITIYQKPCTVADTCSTYCMGSVWSQLNTSWIKDMVVYQGKLIVAGAFTSIGNPSLAANNIAAWNGATWSTLGSGLNDKVYALAVHNGILYAGGNFTLAGGNPVRKIAAWNGTTWSDLPQGGINGSPDHVEALLSSAWGLVVGGEFTSVGNTPFAANNIARWNPGPGWATFGNGFNGPVYSLTHFNGNVTAGGRFGNSPGGLKNLAIWVGFWTKVGGAGAVNLSTPLNTSEGIYAIAQYKTELIVGGQFPSAVSTTVPNGTKTQHLAQWNGAYWTTVGIGPNPPGSSINTGNGVYALKVINNELLVGGQFSQINGQSINNLAKWNGTTWSGFGHPANGIVEAIAVYDSGAVKRCNLYTGGEVLFNQWKCTSVATADKSSVLNITVYPNPAQDKLNIQFNEVIHEKVHLTIYSLMGSKVAYASFDGSNTTKVMNTEKLLPASYVLKVSSAKGSVMKKIIIVR